MMRLLLGLLLLLSISSFAKEADIISPLHFSAIDGVPTNFNMLDVRMGSPLTGEDLQLYLAIHRKTGWKTFTILVDRYKPLPKIVRFSKSGNGCPFGIIEYCEHMAWAVKTPANEWVIIK